MSQSGPKFIDDDSSSLELILVNRDLRTVLAINKPRVAMLVLLSLPLIQLESISSLSAAHVSHCVHSGVEEMIFFS